MGGRAPAARRTTCRTREPIGRGTMQRRSRGMRPSLASRSPAHRNGSPSGPGRRTRSRGGMSRRSARAARAIRTAWSCSCRSARPGRPGPPRGVAQQAGVCAGAPAIAAQLGRRPARAPISPLRCLHAFTHLPYLRQAHLHHGAARQALRR